MKYQLFFRSICTILLLSLVPKAFTQVPSNTMSGQAQVTFEFSEVIKTSGDTRERAVAFHSIIFIDPLAQPIDSIVFGTSEVNAIQSGGWFENEVSGEAGSIQWAGGSTKRAEIRLNIPSGAKGLLLRTLSAKDGLWMEVRIDDVLITTLRVDDFWHSGYVPIEEIIPEPKPATEPTWIKGRYFPYFPSTDRIIVLPNFNTKLNQPHITGAADFRINQEFHTMMALTLTCMQGIINRSKPSIYLTYHQSDEEWLTHLGEHVAISKLDLDKLSAINFILDHYGSHFDGAVIYDPDVPETINLATMIAGLEDRIMLAPDQLTLPGMRTFASVKDLRSLVQEQNWDASEESKLRIYQWVYDNLWPDLEHRLIGVISPGPPTSQEYSPNFYFAMGLGSRDYYTALKVPVLWLDPRNPEEAALYDRFLADAPSPIPVQGASPWEVSSVPFVSSHGDWITALSWPQNPLDGSNLTVFSGVRPELQKYEPRINENRILATLHKQHVAMIFSSDGDNMGYQMYRGFNSFRWFDVMLQDATFGWTTNPALIDIAPVAWNYYVRSRNKAELMCGFSGAGYAQPRSMNQSQLEKYLAHSSTYLNESGLRTIWLLDDPSNSPWNEDLATLYHEGLESADILGFIYGAGANPWRPVHFSFAGAPIPSLSLSHVLEEFNVEQVADRILSQNSDSIFIDLGADYGWHSGQVIQDDKAMGGEALMFSTNSQDYREVMAGPFIYLAPGAYRAKFRLKVSENQDAQDIAKFNISYGEYSGVGGELIRFRDVARKQIAPHDFEEANVYQEVEVPFFLDMMTLNLEFIISIRGEDLELTADNFKIIKEDPDSFPVFAPLLIVTTLGGQQHTLPERFTGLFEGGGGIVLSPDEFMAALNPRYMIELATPILGAGDSSVVKATEQLNDGDYYGSLVTIRNALKGRVVTSTSIPVQSQEFYLSDAYPNPFQHTTIVDISMPKSQYVKAEVFDLMGRRVRTLLNKEMPAGTHEIKFEGRNLESGIYLLYFSAGTFQVIRKILYMP